MPHGRQVQLYPLVLRLELLAVLLDLHHGDGDAVGGEGEGGRRSCRSIGWSQHHAATAGGKTDKIAEEDPAVFFTHLVIEMVSAWVCGMGWRGRETMGLMETPLETLPTPLAIPSLRMI